jgi:hypothetical protein
MYCCQGSTCQPPRAPPLPLGSPTATRPRPPCPGHCCPLSLCGPPLRLTPMRHLFKRSVAPPFSLSFIHATHPRKEIMLCPFPPPPASCPRLTGEAIKIGAAATTTSAYSVSAAFEQFTSQMVLPLVLPLFPSPNQKKTSIMSSCGN